MNTPTTTTTTTTTTTEESTVQTVAATRLRAWYEPPPAPVARRVTTDGRLTIHEFDTYTEYRLDGLLHRDNDLPAIEYTNGTKFWFHHGVLDRPAGGPLYVRNLADRVSNMQHVIYISGIPSISELRVVEW